MTRIIFEDNAIEDIRKLSHSNLKLVKKVFDLIDEIIKSPFEGKGKPEPLKHNYKGYWSRRVSEEHRIIYKIDNDKNIVITALAGHYV